MGKQILTFLIILLCILPAISQSLYDQGEAIAELNSPYDEYRPCIASNGKVIYFSRKGHPFNIGGDDHYDVWAAYQKSSGDWGKAINLGPTVNDKSDNLVVGTSTNGNKLYLLDEQKGLVLTQKKGRGWSVPQAIKIQNFDPTSVPANFYLSGSGQFILISMPAKDSYGGRDLYISTQVKDQLWSEPQNLGSAVNTNKEEYFAALAVDGKTIYFISNGYDDPRQAIVLMSRALNDNFTEWETPQAVGLDVNPQDIGQYFSLSSEGDLLYCSTKGETGNQDIVEIQIAKTFQPKPTVLLSGRLVDAETGQPIKGKVQLQSLSNVSSPLEKSSGIDGSYQLILPRDKDFGITAYAPGYFALSEILPLAGTSSLEELDEEKMTADVAGSAMLSPDAEQIQLRLTKVNKELQQLTEVQRKEALLQAKQVHITKGVPSQTDTELESIRHRYIAITGTDIEEEEPEEVDEELEAMKRKFRKHNDVTTGKGKNRKEKETELEAMKRKFNKENNVAESQQDEKELMDMTVSPKEETPKPFEELVTEVWYELEKQLLAQVSDELKTDLIPEVANQIKSEMDNFTRKGYVNKFQRLANNLESEVKKELRKKYKEEVKRELKGELLELVEEELRETLREDVKRELRKELEEEVRNELRIELESQIRKEIIADLQKDLKSEIEKSKRQDRQPQTPRFQPQKNMQAKAGKVYKEREKLDIKLFKVETGKTIPLTHIFFKANQPTIKRDVSTDLDRVLKLLKENKEVVVEIAGHTNGWCSVEFAKKLSSDRAHTVAGYLIKNGALPEQVQHKGYGRSRPIVPNDSLENCKKNQRIELKILKI